MTTNYTVDLSKPTIKGSTTLGVGQYRGTMVSYRKNISDGTCTLVMATKDGSHFEEVDLGVVENLELGLNSEYGFKIEISIGVVAVLKGNKYRLIESKTREPVTDWINPSELYKTIKENNYKTAVPSITEMWEIK